MTTAGWVVAILWTVIILALIAGAIYWAANALGSRAASTGAAPGEPSAREILDRRLARGELTIEQHAQLREAIGDAPRAAERAEARAPSTPAGATG